MQLTNEIINKDLYGVLGVDKTASPKDINKAFHKLSMEHHPDKNPGDPEKAAEKFKELGEAHDILGKAPKAREAYDQISPYGQHYNKTPTQANNHAKYSPPGFARQTAAHSQANVANNHAKTQGAGQRPPSFAASSAEPIQSQTELASATLSAASGAEKLGQVTMGIGALSLVSGGGFVIGALGVLLTLASSAVKKIEKAELASQVLQKHNNGEEVNPKLLGEANSTMRSIASGA